MTLVPATSAQRFDGGTITEPLVIADPAAATTLLEIQTDNDSALAFALHDVTQNVDLVSADQFGNVFVRDSLGGGITLNGTGLTVAPTGIGGVLTATVNEVTVGIDTLPLGFYGHAPVMQPTGVAVSAAGIHAALVSLGLITA